MIARLLLVAAGIALGGALALATAPPVEIPAAFVRASATAELPTEAGPPHAPIPRDVAL